MKTVMINGSPKKKGSVSAYILGIIRLLIKGPVVKVQARSAADSKRVLECIEDGDNVVFGLPMYVDGVPSHLLAVMKQMEAYCKEKGLRLNVYVASNGGFIEGCQNSALMQVFENFCRRCDFQWRGGVGIGGGVMLNVTRIMFFVFLGLFALNAVTGSLIEAALFLAESMAAMLFLCFGVFFYCLRMGNAIRKGKDCGVKFTRILLPSFLFILIADVFFTVISLFQGGIFKGWLKQK